MIFCSKANYVYVGEGEIEDGLLLKVLIKNDATKQKVEEFIDNLETKFNRQIEIGQRVQATTLQVNEGRGKCEGTLVWLYTFILIVLIVEKSLLEIVNRSKMRSGKVDMVILQDCKQQEEQVCNHSEVLEAEM